MKKLIVISTLALLFGCDAPVEDMYHKGYTDGYTRGFDFSCSDRKSEILGAWSKDQYFEGFSDGFSKGKFDCRTMGSIIEE